MRPLSESPGIFPLSLSSVIISAVSDSPSDPMISVSSVFSELSSIVSSIVSSMVSSALSLPMISSVFIIPFVPLSLSFMLFLSFVHAESIADIISTAANNITL